MLRRVRAVNDVLYSVGNLFQGVSARVIRHPGPRPSDACAASSGRFVSGPRNSISPMPIVWSLDDVAVMGESRGLAGSAVRVRVSAQTNDTAGIFGRVVPALGISFPGSREASCRGDSVQLEGYSAASP